MLLLRKLSKQTKLNQKQRSFLKKTQNADNRVFSLDQNSSTFKMIVSIGKCNGNKRTSKDFILNLEQVIELVFSSQSQVKLIVKLNQHQLATLNCTQTEWLIDQLSFLFLNLLIEIKINFIGKRAISSNNIKFRQMEAEMYETIESAP